MIVKPQAPGDKVNNSTRGNKNIAPVKSVKSNPAPPKKG